MIIRMAGQKVLIRFMMFLWYPRLGLLFANCASD